MSKSACAARRPSVWSLRTFCLITGASRGYGQRAALRFAMRLPSGSVLLLTARDSIGLAATKAMIAKSRPVEEVRVETWSVDLGELTEDTAEERLRAVVPRPGDFAQAVLVHNAATIGDISRLTAQQSDARMMGEYWRINLTSMLIINSAFCQRFSAAAQGDGKVLGGEEKAAGGEGKAAGGEGKVLGEKGKAVGGDEKVLGGEGKAAGGEGKVLGGEGKAMEGEGKAMGGEGREEGTSRLIVHVTSICAKQPFKSFSLYCAAKAARNMLMCTLAEEDSTIRVLNYAPGPLDTDMQAEVRRRAADPELRDMFKAMHEEGRLLTPDQSLDALVYLLDKNSFESGAHIDYYDIDLPSADDPDSVFADAAAPLGGTEGAVKGVSLSTNSSLDTAGEGGREVSVITDNGVSLRN